jgi:hypothetical protein
MNFPRMCRIRQLFEVDRVEDPRATAKQAVAWLLTHANVRPGQTVAITGGSRGIANIARITAGAVAALREAGLQPFVVPAMGSHAGGTAGGQEAVLRHYGVTEDRIGAPVRSSVETVDAGQTKQGIPLTMDKLAACADHILLINRVKPHTNFVGPVESGLAKMLMIGLGKPVGAARYHRAFARFGFTEVIQSAVPTLLERFPVLGGLAVIENALDETARIVPLRAREILEREPALLEEAKRRMARLPFDTLDLLIVDRMGKDISGVGMDTNVVGRGRPGAQIEVIFARDLTPASEGNAAGIGMVDVTVKRLTGKMNPRATFLNCSTALHLNLARVPYAFDTDREALEAALNSISAPALADARVVWIRDTLALSELEVSEALLGEIAGRKDIARSGEPHDIRFHPDGSLVDVFEAPSH